MSTGSGGVGGATRDRIKTSHQRLTGDPECQARIPHRRVPVRPGEGNGGMGLRDLFLIKLIKSGSRRRNGQDEKRDNAHVPV